MRNYELEKPPLITTVVIEPTEPPLVIELVMDIQEAVGARPDGVIGPNSTALMNAQTKLDKPLLFDQYAAPFHTVSGAPKGE